MAQSPTSKNDTPHERPTTPSPRRTSAKRITPKQHAALAGEVLQSVNDHFKRPRSAEDRHDSLGKNVAVILRDVLAPQRILAEKFINDVLFYAQLGTLHYNYHSTTMSQSEQPPVYQQLTQLTRAPNEVSPNNSTVSHFMSTFCSEDGQN